MHFRRLERIGVLFRQRHCLFLKSAGWCYKVARGCWVCICFFPVLLFFPIHAFLCWICSTTTPIFSHRRGTHKLFLEHRWWRVLILPLGFTRSLSFNVSSSCGFDKYLQDCVDERHFMSGEVQLNSRPEFLQIYLILWLALVHWSYRTGPPSEHRAARSNFMTVWHCLALLSITLMKWRKCDVHVWLQHV